jgi:hypothetical protein
MTDQDLRDVWLAWLRDRLSAADPDDEVIEVLRDVTEWLRAWTPARGEGEAT